MSKEIDEKVVSMQFDNSKFEKNVQTTMSTLDKLKQKLHFGDANKGFEDLNRAAKNTNLSPLEKSAEAVRVKFSAMQVAGIAAIDRIANKAMDAGERMVKSLTVDNITAGWSKYNEKTQSVQTLVNSTGLGVEEINNYLSRLMDYSDETSFSFTEMTSALSQMTSSGGDIKKLIPMIMGIANATAFAGKGSAEFQSTIRNLSQSYSAGFLQLQDMKSLNLMGTSSKQLKETFIQTAEELGKIKKGEVTLANFDETLKKKWADTEVMEKSLGKFSKFSQAVFDAVDKGTYETATEAIAAMSKNYDELGVRAFASAQEAKTFTEAIEATKDAVSSGWMDTFEILFGDYEEAKKLWTGLANTLYDVFATGAEMRNAVLKKALGGSSKWEDLRKEVEKTGASFDDFEDEFKKVAKAHGYDIDAMIKEQGSLAKVISSGAIKNLPSLIKETFNSFLTNGKKAADTVKNVTASYEHMQDVVLKVIRGDFSVVGERIDLMAEAGENWAQAQALVDYIWERNGHTWNDCTFTLEEMMNVLGDMTDEELKSTGMTEDQIKAFRELAEQAQKTGTPINELIESMSKPTGKELALDSFHNVFTSLINIINSFKDAWHEIFYGTTDEDVIVQKRADTLYKIIDAIHSLTEKMVINEERADKLRRTFKGVLAIIDILRTILGGGLRIAFKIINAILGAFNLSILDVTAAIGDAIVKFRDWIKEHDLLGRAVSFIATYIAKAFNATKNWIKSHVDLSKVMHTAWSWIKKTYTAVKDWIKNNEALANGLKSVKAWLVSSKDSIKAWFAGLKDADSIPKYIFEGLWKGLKNGAGKIFEAISWVATNLITTFRKILRIESPSKVFIALGGFIISGLVSGLLSGAPSVGDAMKGIAGMIPNFISGLKMGTLGKGLGESLGSVFTSAFDFLKKMDFGQLLAGGGIIALFTTFNKVLKIADKIVNPLDKLGGVFASVGGVLDAAKKNIKKQGTAKMWMMYAEVIKNMAKAILIIAISMFLISKIDEAAFTRTAITVGVMALVLVGLLVYMNIMNKKMNELNVKDMVQNGAKMFSMSGVLIGIAAAMFVMGRLVKKLGEMDAASFWQGIAAVIILTGVIVGIFAATRLIVKNKKGAMADKTMEKMPKMLGKIAMALLTMGVIVKMLGKMDAKNFWQGIAAVVVLAGVIVGLMAATRLITKEKPKNMEVVADLLKRVSKVIAAMAGTAFMLGKMKFANAAQGVGAVTILAGVIVGLMAATKLITKDKPKDMEAMAKMLKSVSGVILKMATMAALLGLLPTGVVVQGGIAIAAFAGIIVGLMAATHFLAKNETETYQMAALLGAVSKAIAVMAACALILGHMDTWAMIQGIAGVAALTGVVIGLMKFAKASPSEGWEPTAKMLFQISVLLVTMSLCAVILGQMNIGDLAKGVAAISVIAYMAERLVKASRDAVGADFVIKQLRNMMLALGVILIILSFLDPKSVLISAASLSLVMEMVIQMLKATSKYKPNTKPLKEMMVCLLVVGLLIGLLATLNPKAVLASAAAISLVLLALVGVLGILSYVNKVAKPATVNKAAKTLLTASMAFIPMVFALLLLSGAKNAIKNAGALSILLGSITLVVAGLGVLGKMIQPATIKKAATALVTASVALIPMALALIMMNGVKNAIKNALSLSVLLAIMTVAVGLLGVMGKFVGGGNMVKGAAALTVASVALLPMVLALKLMSGVKHAIDSAVALSILVGALSLVLIPLSLVGAVIPMALLGVLGLTAMVVPMLVFIGVLALMNVIPNAEKNAYLLTNLMTTISELAIMLGLLAPVALVGAAAATAVTAMMTGVAILVTAIGGIFDAVPGLEKLLDNGIRILIKLAGGIGEMVGAFIAAIATSIMGLLPALGDSLGQFMNGAMPFIEGMKKCDVSVLEGIGIITAAILALTVADVIEAIATFLTGQSFAELGTELSNFMTNASVFFEGAKQINPETAKAVKNIADMILILTAADLLDALTDWLTGGSSIADFGKDLIPFGADLKQFSDNLDGINVENIKAASEAGKALAEMADKVPNEGGVLGWFAGENSISKFGREIADFGLNLMDFSDNVDGINVENVKAASEAGKALAEMADKVPNEGGVAGFFAGENSLAKFSSEIVAFGASIMAFSVQVDGLNVENVKAASEAGKALAAMADKIPNEGGVAAFFAGDNSLANFSTEIVAFGGAMMGFSLAVSNLKEDKVKAATKAGKDLVDMTNSVPNSGGVAGFFAGDKSLAAYGEDFGEFGKHLKQFSTAVSGVNSKSMGAATEAAKQLVKMVKDAPNLENAKVWFCGKESMMSYFGSKVADFGKNMKLFSLEVDGVNAEGMKAATDAGKAVADMVNTIPAAEGLAAWFGKKDSVLSYFGKDVAKFGEHMAEFSLSVADIKPDNMKAATDAGLALAELCNTVPASENMTRWFGKGEGILTYFGKDSEKYGEHMKKFSDGLEGINPENMKAATDAGLALATLCDTVPAVENMSKWFGKEGVLSYFGEDISGFAENMKKFSNTIGDDFKVDSVKAATDAGLALAQMMGTIPERDALVAWLMGSDGYDPVIKYFGDDVVSYAGYLVEFCNKIAGIDFGTIVNAQGMADLGKMLNEIFNAVPEWIFSLAKDGSGYIRKQTQKSDMAKLGLAIVDLAESLATFATTTAEIDSDKIKSIAEGALDISDAFLSFASAYDNKNFDSKNFSFALQNLGIGLNGFWNSAKNIFADAGDISITDEDVDIMSQKIDLMLDLADVASAFGVAFKDIPNNIQAQSNNGGYGVSSTVDSFVSAINKFGNAFVDLYEATSQFTDEGVANVNLALNGIASLSDSISKLESNAVGKAAYMVEELVNLVNAMSAMDSEQFAANIGTVSAGIDTMNETIDAKGETYKSSGSALSENLVEGLKSHNATIKKAMTGSVSTNIENLKAKEKDYTDAGSALAGAFVTALKSKNETIKTAMTGSIDTDVDNIEAKYQSFYDAGKYLAAGLIEGMTNDTTLKDVHDAAKTMGEQAVAGELEGQESHSPSKATFRAAIYLAQGLINGIGHMSDRVYDASSEMGTVATSGVSRAISSIASVINSDIDTEPTIRPVLDLSDIQAKSMYLNSMLGSDSTFGIRTNVRAVKAGMDNRQNGTTDDVIDAINRLGENGAGTGDTYNINGITYDDGSNIYEAVQTLVRAAKVERRT